jgi:uncharacterized protein
VIFVDSNIPMYLVGAAHPNKAHARRLEDAIAAGERLVTSAEVLQEDAIQPAFDALLGVVNDVLPIGRKDVERAREFVLGRQGLSARDALHRAVMKREQISRIMSFDAGFDDLPGITRLGA